MKRLGCVGSVGSGFQDRTEVFVLGEVSLIFKWSWGVRLLLRDRWVALLGEVPQHVNSVGERERERGGVGGRGVLVTTPVECGPRATCQWPA